MIEKSKRNSRDQWFHGSLDRKGAEKLLNLYPPGSFLVRQTGDNSGHFSSGFGNPTGSVGRPVTCRLAISDRQNRVNRGIFGSDWNSVSRSRGIRVNRGCSDISAGRVNRAFRDVALFVRLKPGCRKRPKEFWACLSLIEKSGGCRTHLSLSVVGPDKVTHHFVLEQKYGTICIGSSVYSNLESVIDNYMSQPLFPTHVSPRCSK